MNFYILIFAGYSILHVVGASLDSPFAMDPEELQLKEIAESVRIVSGAVMGLTEYVMEIRNELKTIRTDISLVKTSTIDANKTTRPITYYSGRPIRDPEEIRRQSLELADKVERLLAMDQSPEVDLAKEELRRTVEKNFLRMLAAILVTGPAHTQERSDDIFKLMRSVLNGELDFTPVVQRLPLILRDSETNQFVNLLITLRESERGASGGSFRHEILSSIENTEDAVQGQSRQIIPPFPIPNSPNSNTNIPANPPPYVNNFQNFQTRTRPQSINNLNRAGPNFIRVPPNNNRIGPSNIAPNNIVPNNVGLNNIGPNNINRLGPNIIPGIVPNNGINGIPPNNNRIVPIPNNNRIGPNNVNPNVNAFNPNANNVDNINLNSADNNNLDPNNPNAVGENGQTPGQNNPNANQLPSINSLLDAMNQTNQLIKEIPTLVEGLQTLIESFEGLLG